MMDFIEKVIGPYPFDGYGAVTVDDPALYYALETQAMSTFSSTDVNDLTVVHELAHQWFGDAVTVSVGATCGSPKALQPISSICGPTAATDRTRLERPICIDMPSITRSARPW